MLPDRVSNPGPLTYESGALPIALRGPAQTCVSVDRQSISPLEDKKLSLVFSNSDISKYFLTSKNIFWTHLLFFIVFQLWYLKLWDLKVSFL